MALLSSRARQKAWDIGLTVCVAALAWFLQTTVLNELAFQGAFCNLPLVLTILWGFVFGSRMPPILADDLRTRSAREIFLHQAASGSGSGLLFGAFIAAIYSSVLPVYPLCYPVTGWACGYFCMRNLNPEVLMCIPVVLVATVAAELMMALQLHMTGHAGVFPHLAQIVLPEALLNALIAPFVYFPMRSWHEFFSSVNNPA